MPKSHKSSHKKKVKVKAIAVVKRKVKRKAKKAVSNNLKGHGGYWSDKGAAIGGHVGGIADSVVGLGKMITGLGSYKIKKNSIAETNGPPTVKNGKHYFRMFHREFLGDVVGSADWKVHSYPINPGVVQTMPWCAGIATAFEQYIVHGIVFEFKSTSATALNSTNTALGTVIMATEYNSNLPNFLNKMEMENHEYSDSGAPTKHMIHPIECARKYTPLTELYVRSAIGQGGTSSHPSSNSINLLSYDLGNFQIATVGMQASATIGELWISYDIEFIKPTLNQAVTNNQFIHYYWDSVLGTAPTAANWFLNLRNKNTRVPVGFVSGFTNLNAGRYVIVINVYGSGTVAAFPTITYTGGASALYLFTTSNLSGGATQTQVNAGNGTAYMYAAYAVTSDTTWGYTFTGGAVPTAITNYDLMMFPIGAGLSASRKAVDYDPSTVINRRLDKLFELLDCKTLSSIMEDDEKEQFLDSDEDTVVNRSLPVHVSDSTMNLAQALRGVLSKTLPDARL